MKKILYADGIDNYIYIYHKINIFLKTNPPCKECLVQAVCVEDISDIPEKFVGMQIKSCNLLRKFIKKEQKKFNHI